MGNHPFIRMRYFTIDVGHEYSEDKEIDADSFRSHIRRAAMDYILQNHIKSYRFSVKVYENTNDYF